MNKIQQFILFMSSFTLGLLVPLYNLILLEKGASIQLLPILLVIYSITLLSFELPTGICADLFGRKIMFLISCCFQLISFLIILLANNFIWLIIAMIFNGLGRAFSSGSLDALFIDQAITLNGDTCLSKITTRIAILEGWGLAVGGIAGGFIADLSGIFFTIIIKLVFLATLFALCLFFVKEEVVSSTKQRIPLWEHLKKGKEVIQSSFSIRLILGGIFLVGFMIMTIETYWQPAFLKISKSENNTWMLGIITFFGFLAITIGNTISNKLLVRFENKWWNIYNICRIIFGICVISFGISQSTINFIFWYIAIYMLLGSSNVVENTLINKIIPNNMRASILSLNSLIFQAGAMCASLFSSMSVKYIQFSGIWVVTGLLLGSYALVVIIISLNKKNLFDKKDFNI